MGLAERDLHKGDMLAFTAQTPHAVDKLESGERYVLIVFGEYRR